MQGGAMNVPTAAIPASAARLAADIGAGVRARHHAGWRWRLIRLMPLFFLACIALPAWPDSKAELKALRERLQKLQHEYQETRESHADAADSLKQSERAISDAKRKLQQLEAEQLKTRNELNTVNGELEQVQSRIEDRQGRLGWMLRQAYMRGGGDTLKLLLSGQDPDEIARKLVYLNYLSQGQLELLNTLRQAQGQLDELKQSAADKDRTLTEIKQSKVAEQASLLKEKQARQSVLNRLSGQIKAQRREISTLKRDERRLADLLARLARLAQQRQAKAKKNNDSRSPQAKPADPLGVNTKLPEAIYGEKPFSRLKGLLRLPVRGELMNRFGAPREGGGLSWKGLFIRTQEGAEVKAVAAGQVVFAEWLRGFGNLVIVDHGEGYMSLYSNNESLYKQPGEGVKTGDTVATAGNSGGQEEPGVYFELRHQGRPINPMAWIK
jgi:murein hydrolase activator